MMIGESRWCEELQRRPGEPHAPHSVLEHRSGQQPHRAAVSAPVNMSAVMGPQMSTFLGPRDTQPGPSGHHGKLRGLLGVKAPCL